MKVGDTINTDQIAPEFEMKFEESIILHYLYGYQPMRLASFEEVNRNLENAVTKHQNGDAKSKRMKIENEEEDDILEALPRKIRVTDGIALCVSSIPGATYGACAIQNIPAGTWFGPFEGRLVRRDESLQGELSEFMWEIFHDGEVSHFLDGRNQYSWMSFVKCARYKKEQNMVVFQYHGCIYYRTIREIESCSELLVWYDNKYTQLLGMPLTWNDTKSTSGKRKLAGRRSAENLQKKKHRTQKTGVPSTDKKPNKNGASPNTVVAVENNELVGSHLTPPSFPDHGFCPSANNEELFAANENKHPNHFSPHCNKHPFKHSINGYHASHQNSTLGTKCMQIHATPQHVLAEGHWPPVYAAENSNHVGPCSGGFPHAGFTHEHNWSQGSQANVNADMKMPCDYRYGQHFIHLPQTEPCRRQLEFS